MQKFSIYSYFKRFTAANTRFSTQKLFNKRRFLSLIVQETPYTFVSSSKNRLKDKPMTALLKTSSTSTTAFLARTLMLLAALLVSLQGNAQGWEIYFGGNNDDQGQSIIQTQDHGYVGVGYSESTGGGNGYQVYAIRADVDGNEAWSNLYAEGFTSYGYSITETPDHGFLLVGKTKPTQLSDFNVLLLKINAEGQKQWSKQFGGAGDEQGFRIIPTTASGGYLIVGTTNSFGNGENDAYLLKVDAQGNEVWSQTYGTSGDEDGYSVAELADGYLLTGTADNLANGTKDGYLVKVDLNGNPVWSKYFGVANDIDQLRDIAIAADGNVVLAGHTGSTSQGWLIKTDLDGNEIWSKTFGNLLGDETNDLLIANNGDLVVTGFTEVSAANVDAFLARFDNDGNNIWTNNIGRGSHADIAQGVTASEDGGFVAIGYNSLFGIFFNDVTFIKTGADGSVYTNHLTGRVFKDGG
ncbi:MAG: hypothetical protein IT258_08705, partial [Saprospiraceae bacterium]|nr:hypothetical protein [Saprospiraceae bacterium]